MQFRYLGLAASLALAANAIVIPPNVALEELSGNIETPYNSADVHPPSIREAVLVPCQGCPQAKRYGDEVSVTQHFANGLLFDFQMSSANTLLLNGVMMYPLEPLTLSVVQVATEGPMRWTTKDAPALRITRMQIVVEEPKPDPETGKSRLSLWMTISRIADWEVKPMTIAIVLDKDENGQLSIVKTHALDKIEYIRTVGPNEVQSIGDLLNPHDCKGMPPVVCKWKAIIAARIRQMKNAASRPYGRKPCHKHMKGFDRLENGRQRFRHHNGHHYGHRHHKAMRVMHRVFRAISSVVIPILFGVAVGTATYLIGWTAGAVAAALYARYHRRCGYGRIALDDNNDNDDSAPSKGDEPYHDSEAPKSEKEAYVAEEIAEVEGEAPPVYVEVAGIEVVTK